MKKFNHRILTKWKIIVIFLFAIFLPTVIVGFLSIGTFSQRREAVKKLLESNRWVVGESAVNSLENGLIEYERKELTALKLNSDSFQTNGETSGNFFLLDADFNIICPKTGKNLETVNSWEKEEPASTFSKDLQKAESLEFSSKNYNKAAVLYRECMSRATTNQQRALLLERAGSCQRTEDENYK